MDDIVASKINLDELNHALRECVDWSKELGLKFCANECEIRKTNIHHLGSAVTPRGILTRRAKIQYSLEQIRLPNTVKQVKHLIGLGTFLRNFNPNDGLQLLPIDHFLRKKNLFTVTNDYHEPLNTSIADLTRTLKFTLRLANSVRQFL